MLGSTFEPYQQIAFAHDKYLEEVILYLTSFRPKHIEYLNYNVSDLQNLSCIKEIIIVIH